MSIIRTRLSSGGFFRFDAGVIKAAIFRPRQNRTYSQAAISEESIKRYTQGGYHPVRIGDQFQDGRYRVTNKLGYGAYSTVWLVQDTRSRQHRALKILTAETYGSGADSFELSILQHLNNTDAFHPGAKHVLGLVDHFKHQGPHGEHVCLVFKAMGPELAVYRRQFPQRQIPVKLLKQISRQLLLALFYLHRSGNIVHTDIKPQNILVESTEINEMFQFAPSSVFEQFDGISKPPDDYYMESTPVASAEEDLSDPNGFSVRLGDFGTSSYHDRHLTEWIQPESLRAPEVILQTGWNWSVDIWNLACVLWEFAEGKVLFDGCAVPSAPYSSASHLAQMQALFGPMPNELVRKSPKMEKFYDCEGTLRSASQFAPVSLDELATGSSLSGAERTMFLEFIQAMLKLNPDERPSAERLLQMAWLN